MTVPQRYGVTFPFDGIPLVEQREIVQEVERPRIHRPVVGGVGWLRRVHADRRGRAQWAHVAALRHRDRPGVHAWRAHARVDGRERCARPHPGGSRSASAPRRTSSSNAGTAWRSTSRTSACATRSGSCAPRSRARRSTEDYETFAVNGFRLGITVPEQPPILVAALREGMLRLAGREGDGAIINWLSADDVKTVVAARRRRQGDRGAHLRVPGRRRRASAYAVGKRAIASYLTVPVYAAFHEWLGRGDELADLWRLWKEGDRKAAADSIPDSRRRPAARVGQARAVPRAHPALHRQRRDDTGARAVLRTRSAPDGARSAQALNARSPASATRKGRERSNGLELHVVVADVREAQEHERAHQPPAGVDLAPLEREPRRGGRGVVVVVQALAGGHQREQLPVRRGVRRTAACRAGARSR